MIFFVVLKEMLNFYSFIVILVVFMFKVTQFFGSYDIDVFLCVCNRTDDLICCLHGVKERVTLHVAETPCRDYFLY